jgi:uncharacterized protein
VERTIVNLDELIRKYSSAPDFYGENITGVESRTFYGDQLLHAACVTGAIEDVKFLISIGADINSKGDSGYTPLHYAAEQNHTDVAIFLLKAGATLNVRDNDGNTPLELAELSENVEVCEAMNSIDAEKAGNL